MKIKYAIKMTHMVKSSYRNTRQLTYSDVWVSLTNKDNNSKTT